VVVAHLGRPKGAPDPGVLAGPVAERLQELLGVPVRMAQDVVGESAAEAVRATEPDRVVLLENVRFEAGETSKDDAERGAFADRWPRSATCTSTTPSAPCTASTPASTTSPSGSRTPPARWWPPRWPCSGG
jgi:hypothetical protein